MSDVARTPFPGATTAARAAALGAALGALALLLCWGPFLGERELLARHFDGPNYLVVAKTLYRPTAASPLPGYVSSPGYFAVHLPVYPLVVRASAAVVGWGDALLLATALFSIGSAALFALWAREADGSLFLPAAVGAFVLLPPRAFLYRGLGATEAPMALFALAALLAARKERWGWAFAAASLATLTRINGVLVVGVLFLALLGRRRPLAAFAGAAAAVAPLGLVFAWHGRVLGDPLALFHVHGGKGAAWPFAWVAERAAAGEWTTAEMLAGLFVLHVLGALVLWTRGARLEAGLVAAHVVLYAFLRESDVARYFLTVTPLVLVLTFREVFRDRRLATAALVPLAALSVAYAWTTVPTNLCHPVAWRALVALLGG